MTDITAEFNELLTSRNARGIPARDGRLSAEHITDDFLKEAYKINEHISSLLAYLNSIRQSYLAVGPRPAVARRQTAPSATLRQQQRQLTDEERNRIDSETAALLHELSASISGLASAEHLRRETQATILLKKFPLANGKIWKWASGISQDGRSWRSEEQERLEGQENTIKTVRESMLWTLRTGLESVAEVQRHMVEKRVERINEKEKSILYKMNKHGAVPTVAMSSGFRTQDTSTTPSSIPPTKGENALQEDETAEIESQLSPEQLQLFVEENNDMLRHYEETLDKAQNVERSLLEITSLQQSLVSHLTTQDEMITQLVADAGNTQTNVTKGNRELKRASERSSVARWFFYSTAGLCASLVVWDAIF
ncbi:hypothetical protein KEM56_000580 [Ascosphaera pollenicola]|nr:hypothetical protein KEM56_000580 [Ascosphaera pollenicola]